MDSTNTVTISIDEYFELRTKAQMNEFLLKEFGIIDARLNEFDRKLYDMDYAIKILNRECKINA